MPQSHLDLESITALNEALKILRSMIFASDDTQFYMSLATQVLELRGDTYYDLRMGYDTYLQDASDWNGKDDWQPDRRRKTQAAGEQMISIAAARRCIDQAGGTRGICRVPGCTARGRGGFDLLQERISAERIMADVDAVLVGEAERLAFATKPRGSSAPALGEIAVGFPMFCSCFGFQGLALALGADVQPDAEGAEVGTYSITVREEGKSNPLFSKLPDTFMAQQGARTALWNCRGIPPGCPEKCPYQAIRYKDHLVYATQFHPELDGAAQSSRFRNYFDLYKECTARRVPFWKKSAHRRRQTDC